MTPFLKWPGGKRWFIAHYADILPSRYNRYIEPFLGSGAVFFHLQPRRATLADLNADLVTVYRGIKRDWRRLVRLLRRHQKDHCDHYYYAIRDVEPEDTVERAARLIYLNRTCFNGIYRVNLEGQFNVPKGTKKKVVLPSDDFHKVTRLLARARLCVSDFEPIIDGAEPGDLVFADPPYTVRHNNNAFIKYNEKLFSWNDQIRLGAALARAHKRGVSVVSTNANHPSVRELYAGNGFSLKTVSRFSPISAKAESRKQFEELVISSYGKGG